MAYVVTKLKTLPFQKGHLAVDSNSKPMTGVVGWQMQSQDANSNGSINSGNPQTSPVTVNTTVTLTVPNLASHCLLSSASSFNITEDSSYTAYFVVPANIVYTFDCAGEQYIYLQTASSQAVSFQFRMLEAG